MNKMLKKGLLMFAAGAFVASCADYNETYNFAADPDPSYSVAYADLAPVKEYINRTDNPNLSVNTNILLTEFNSQALEHAAAVTNFNGVAFGYSFMPDKYVSKKGYMNFMAFKDALGHASEIGTEVYGSPIVANEQQSDEWFGYLTAPIEVQVLPIDDKEIDYTTVDEFTGTYEGRNKPTIVKNLDDKGNALQLPTRAKVYIIEDFDLDMLGYYTITFTVKTKKDKDENIQCTFADSLINTGKDKEGKLIAKKFPVRPGVWQTVKVEAMPSKEAKKGYFKIEGNLNTELYIRNVKVIHTPDNHRDQTKDEKSDTIQYAIRKWCDGLMEANAGRIKSFDLIDKPLGTTTLADNPDILDLKHSTDKIFWQDYLDEGDKSGSELYGATVSKVARAAFQKHGGNLDELKFYISETGLEDQQRFNSLMHWIGVWEQNGAVIDGINAELNLVYSEDASKLADTKANLNTLIENLVKTGKKVRLSNLDIKYEDAEGNPVTANQITKEQRQKLADFNAEVVKAYMTIPADQQGGLCKGNMADNTTTVKDPVGLWTKETNSWVRNATYEAFCKALAGKVN